MRYFLFFWLFCVPSLSYAQSAVGIWENRYNSYTITYLVLSEDGKAIEFMDNGFNQFEAEPKNTYTIDGNIIKFDLILHSSGRKSAKMQLGRDTLTLVSDTGVLDYTRVTRDTPLLYHTLSLLKQGSYAKFNIDRKPSGFFDSKAISTIDFYKKDGTVTLVETNHPVRGTVTRDGVPFMVPLGSSILAITKDPEFSDFFQTLLD
ncbi:MAG: hypothetical protein ACQETX_08560 [Pseudomonadota bacterium]